jgi:hypothetical protein
MKKALAGLMVALLLALPTLASAGMLDVGADRWDTKYQKSGALAGKYGERQIDKDGLDCTPLDVKFAVVAAYASLLIPAFGLGEGARTGAHYIVQNAATAFTKGETFHPAQPGEIAKSGGRAAFNPTALATITGFVGSMALAMYLSDAEAHAKCMQAKGYNISGGFVNTEHVGARGVPLNQYKSGFGGVQK